jgi:hypothetical protein
MTDPRVVADSIDPRKNGYHSGWPNNNTLIAASDLLRGMGWRKIEEAPKDGTHVLVWYPFGEGHTEGKGCMFIGFWAYATEEDGDSAASPSWCDPTTCESLGDGFTYWRPLPTPPEEEKK